jgi:hypothetical protein
MSNCAAPERLTSTPVKAAACGFSTTKTALTDWRSANKPINGTWEPELSGEQSKANWSEAKGGNLMRLTLPNPRADASWAT